MAPFQSCNLCEVLTERLREATLRYIDEGNQYERAVKRGDDPEVIHKLAGQVMTAYAGREENLAEYREHRCAFHYAGFRLEGSGDPAPLLNRAAR